MKILVAEPAKPQTAENPPKQLSQGLIALISANLAADIMRLALARFDRFQPLIKIVQFVLIRGLIGWFICHVWHLAGGITGIVIPAKNGAEPTQETPKGQAIEGHKVELFENK